MGNLRTETAPVAESHTSGTPAPDADDAGGTGVETSGDDDADDAGEIEADDVEDDGVEDEGFDCCGIYSCNI